MLVYVQKLLFKKYMKNHKIYIFLNKVGEENNRRRAHTSTWFKKNIGVCITFIVFMINLANLEVNYQRLSLSLS